MKYKVGDTVRITCEGVVERTFPDVLKLVDNSFIYIQGAKVEVIKQREPQIGDIGQWRGVPATLAAIVDGFHILSVKGSSPVVVPADFMR